MRKTFFTAKAREEDSVLCLLREDFHRRRTRNYVRYRSNTLFGDWKVVGRQFFQGPQVKLLAKECGHP